MKEMTPCSLKEGWDCEDREEVNDPWETSGRLRAEGSRCVEALSLETGASGEATTQVQCL